MSNERGTERTTATILSTGKYTVFITTMFAFILVLFFQTTVSLPTNLGRKVITQESQILTVLLPSENYYDNA